jgi:hypothetical protein
VKIGAKTEFRVPKKGMHDAVFAECVMMPRGPYGPNAAIIFLIDETDQKGKHLITFFFFNPDAGFGSPEGKKGSAFRRLLQNITGHTFTPDQIRKIASGKSNWKIEDMVGHPCKIFIKHKQGEDKDGEERIFASIDVDLCEQGDNSIDLEGYVPYEERKKQRSNESESGDGEEEEKAPPKSKGLTRRSAAKKIDEEEDDESFEPSLEDDDEPPAKSAKRKSKMDAAPWGD